MDNHRIKDYCAVAAFTVVLYLVLNNLGQVARLCSAIAGLLTPFFIGIVLAFILNRLMILFETHVYASLKHGKHARLIRPLALVSTYLALCAALSVLAVVVVPQLTTSVAQLADALPGYMSSLQSLAQTLEGQIILTPELQQELNAWFQTFTQQIINALIQAVPELFTMLVSLGGGVFTAAIGVIVSIYILLSKEVLLSQLARLNRAFLPRRAADYAAEAGAVSSSIFGKYIAGQLTDALIVGAVSVLGLSVLGFPYAMLIGVVMGVTNIIPFFGPFIGAVPGFLILLMADPVKALWYILFVVIVQQIDGNIIAPRVIGGSVGLPPLWVLFSVTVGGGLFGLAGMVLGTPVFAIFYTLLGRATRARESR